MSQTRESKTGCGTGNYSVIFVPKSSINSGTVKHETPYGGAKGSVSNSPVGTYGAYPLYCAL
jgi:hypothetical protein